MDTSRKGKQINGIEASLPALVDMFCMSGFAPRDIAIKSLRYKVRNLASGYDKEVQEIYNGLLEEVRGISGFLSKEATGGLVLHSGTEANETALYLARVSTDKRYVVTTNTSHRSIINAARKLGMQVLIADVEPDTLQVDSSRLEKVIEPHLNDIACVNATAGTTQFGVFEQHLLAPIIQELADRGTWLHSDAAYGGFVQILLPAPYKKREDTLFVPDVKSLTIDPHKFIGVYGCGLLLLRSKEDEMLLGSEVSYFPGKATALGTSRSAYETAVALASIRLFGYGGLQKLAQECVDKAKDIAKQLERVGLQILAPIKTGIVPFRLDSELQTEYMVTELYKRGFKTSPILIQGTDAQNHPYTIHGIAIVITPRPEMHEENIKRFCQAACNVYKEMKR